MPSLIRSLLARIGGGVPLTAITRPPSTTVLMYHGVSRTPNECGFDAAAFEAQIELLSRRVVFVRASEITTGCKSRQLRVALTFDDGYRNNADIVAPILRKYQAPATFFICHRNTELRKPTWFTYLKALERFYSGTELRFLDHTLDMSAAERKRSVKVLESILLAARPHPSAMYRLIEEELPPLESLTNQAVLTDDIYGMTIDQIRGLAADPLFDLGAHTMDHPLLPLCDDAEMKYQIAANQEWLSEVSGRHIDSIAYPNGDCTREVIEFCRDREFRYGYAVNRKIIGDPALEIRRAGVYYPSLTELQCKIHSTELAAVIGRFPRLRTVEQ